VPEDAAHNCSHTSYVGEWQHSYISDEHGRLGSWRLASSRDEELTTYGESTSEGAIVPMPSKPDHLMAVVRTGLGDQMQSDGTLPVHSHYVGQQPAVPRPRQTSRLAERWRTVATGMQRLTGGMEIWWRDHCHQP
jgi:hypothetical protein